MTTRIHAALAVISILLLGAPLWAHAHLMVEQRGTINIVGDGAFIVVSVPVAAFPGVDDDGDGRLSRKELSSHYREISAQVETRLQLRNDAGPRPLQGLLLNLADDHSSESSTQLVVMGRFALASTHDALRLRTSLFGRTEAERVLEIAAKRGGDASVLVLTAEEPERVVFPVGAVRPTSAD